MLRCLRVTNNSVPQPNRRQMGFGRSGVEIVGPSGNTVEDRGVERRTGFRASWTIGTKVRTRELQCLRTREVQGSAGWMGGLRADWMFGSRSTALLDANSKVRCDGGSGNLRGNDPVRRNSEWAYPSGSISTATPFWQADQGRLRACPRMGRDWRGWEDMVADLWDRGDGRTVRAARRLPRIALLSDV